MKFDISTVISVLAILVMFYCLWLVLSLRKNVPGGRGRQHLEDAHRPGDPVHDGLPRHPVLLHAARRS